MSISPETPTLTRQREAEKAVEARIAMMLPPVKGFHVLGALVEQVFRTGQANVQGVEIRATALHRAANEIEALPQEILGLCKILCEEAGIPEKLYGPTIIRAVERWTERPEWKIEKD